MGILILAALIILAITVYNNKRAEEEKLAEDRKELIRDLKKDRELLELAIIYNAHKVQTTTPEAFLAALETAPKEKFYNISREVLSSRIRLNGIRLEEAAEKVLREIDEQLD